MSDLSAWAIATCFAAVFAPWYIVVTLLIGTVWLLLMELP